MHMKTGEWTQLTTYNDYDDDDGGENNEAKKRAKP